MGNRHSSPPAANLGLYAILFASFVWGTTGTTASFAPEVSPIAIGAAAMGIGGLLQALLARKALCQDWRNIIAHHWLLGLGGLCVALYPLAFYASMRLAGVAIGTVISIGAAPLFAALIERLWDKTLLSRRWLISALIAIAGVAMISFSSHPDTATPASELQLGLLLGLAAALSYAIYTWTARKLMLGGIGSSAAMGATFGLGGILLMPVLALSGGAFLDSWLNFSVGAYMALVPMFLGYVAFGYGLARIKASTVTTITLLEPVIAALLALILLGEKLSLMGWFGMVLVGIGLLALTLPLRQKPH